jgi:subtilisin family serine protease
MTIAYTEAGVASSDRQSVIIRMAHPPHEITETAQGATAALRRRSLALSARDCLPPDRTPGQTSSRATPRPQVRADAAALKGSLLVQAPTSAARDVDDLRDEMRHRLQPLVDNERVQHALELRGVSLDDALSDLWTSGAVALDLAPEDIAALLEEVPDIAAIDVNRQLRLPPVVEVLNVPEGVRERRAASYGLDSIRALATWGAHDARGAGVRVGILDTGVDATHPDLADRVVAWAEFDADGHEVSSEPHDADRHGTHVAGTIAGRNTSGQWIGVAPECELCCAKVLGAEGGTDNQILAGLRWAIEQQVDVISMSLGGLTLGPEMPSTYTEAIVAAIQQGIPVVVAIGNEGSQTAGSPGNDIFALAVGATDYRDRPAGFSGGRTQVVFASDFIRADLLPLPYSKPDVSAPGVAIVSSVPGGGWAALNGTSMATPHVAGAIALLLSATKIRQDVKTEERAFLISDLITGSVEELGEAGQDHRYGFGRLDVLRAVDFARERGY